MDKIAYYDSFELKVNEEMLSLCRQRGFVDDRLLVVEELEQLWHKIAPEYMIDAMREIASYPMVSIAWAAYLGMGVAVVWDAAWDENKERDDLYQEFASARGFDCMDEYVVEECYGIALASNENKQLGDLYRDLSERALALIHKEGVEPQSVDAVHIYARTLNVFFRVGVSVGLRLLGYGYHKATLS